MKIEFIKNENDKRIGYKLISETEDEFLRMGVHEIDMIFFGSDGKEIVYDGRETTPDDKSIQALR